MASENCGAIPVERLAHFPAFCAPILKDDDPTLATGINFWAVQPSDDAEYDHWLGDLNGQEAVHYIRDRNEPAFLGCVLMWMGARVLDEERCPGPLERGFLERIRKDCPDAVEWVVMHHFRHHPEQLN